MNELKKYIDVIADFPVKGISFKDISPLLKEKFNEAIDGMKKLAQDVIAEADTLVAIDARGFIFGSALAYSAQKKLVIVRKKGKLPPETSRVSYHLEYSDEILEIKKNIISVGEKLVIVDDIYATGGTFSACKQLVEQSGGIVLCGLFLIDLGLVDHSSNIKSLIKY